MFVDEVVNEITGVFVLKCFLIDTCLLEKLLEIRVDVLQVKAVIGVPANVTDVLEVGRHSNIFLVQPFLPSFVYPALVLVLGDARLQSGAPTQTIQGLGWGNTCSVALLLLFFVRLPLLPSLFSLQQLLLNRLPENVGLPLVGKVETDLSVVPLKGVEVRSG